MFDLTLIQVQPEDAETLHLKNNVDATKADTQLLKVAMHFVCAACPNGYLEQQFVWINRADPSESKKTTQYPEVEFMFEDDPSELPKQAEKKTKEAAVITLLRLASVTASADVVSELAVERSVGAALSGVFYSADKIHVTSTQKQNLSDILRPTASHVFPDLSEAVRRTGSTTYHIEPVAIIGEAEAERRGSEDDTIPKAYRPSARVQMTAAVHGTLILLVLAHCQKNNIRLQDFKTNPEVPPFDEKSMVYGVHYDEAKIQVYVHFPQVMTVDGHNVIRFFQLRVASYTFAHSSYWTRWLMACALFAVQKHADLISDVLVDVLEGYSYISGSK
ncbi:hypothetical protein R3P38DRAFT_1285676 [Favolaschia claudopus]|uniref:Uncharacterized protein n=1 Tax=Favolaschia claudopus TaxID=2862362 RepID=A0AAW0B1E6_9AGAR